MSDRHCCNLNNNELEIQRRIGKLSLLEDTVVNRNIKRPLDRHIKRSSYGHKPVDLIYDFDLIFAFYVLRLDINDIIIQVRESWLDMAELSYQDDSIVNLYTGKRWFNLTAEFVRAIEDMTTTAYHLGKLCGPSDIWRVTALDERSSLDEPANRHILICQFNKHNQDNKVFDISLPIIEDKEPSIVMR